MDIDVYQHGPNETVLLNPIPTRCNSTKKDKGLSLLEYEQLQFVSRVVGGMFSFGYCIQIGIVHKQNVKDNIYLEIACENQTITTHTDTPTYPQTTINDVITSSQIISTLSTTMSMSDQSQIHDETDVEGDNTLYIAEGAGGGFVLCVLVVVVILLCKRRKSHHSRKKDSNANCTANSIAADDDEDDGLKYNMLYVSSERHDDIDVNYSTADGDTPRHISCEDEGCYSSVDDTKIIQNSNSYTHEVTNTAFEFSEDNSVEHKNAPIERGCVYAVVDKSHKTNSSVKNIENASSSATYAVVDKNIMRHQQEGNT
ncbi:uncharacterized protein LOC134688115 [Mytilus trossulus]|uniref:uncharacterized protein LOC134688115 n=1 Tax=Mytilus trossulus TaxID=6551 RepID=UPI003007510C